MLQYNTMRFGTDEFNPYIRQALLVSSTPVDLSDFNRLDQISILGNQPDGSKRRFMFKMGDKVYKFDDQNAVVYSGDITIDNVLQDGNTAAQVEAVRSNKVLVGNKIFPIIALYSDSQDSPSAKLVFTASSAVEELDSTKEMTAQYFHDADINPEGGRVDGTVLGFSWDIDTNGDASAGFKVQLLQNGEWSNYLTLTEAKGQNAQGIRSKWYYHVDAANGINSVKINKFRVHWSPYTNFNVYGDTAYLTSTVENFGVNLTGCVLVVRHEDLEGGSIDAHVSFQKKRNTVIGEVVPIVYGSNVFELAHYPIIATLKVFVDGVLTQPDDIYTASISKNCHFILNVPDGAVVTANYQYGGDDLQSRPITACSLLVSILKILTTPLSNSPLSDLPLNAAAIPIRLRASLPAPNNAFISHTTLTKFTATLPIGITTKTPSALTISSSPLQKVKPLISPTIGTALLPSSPAGKPLSLAESLRKGGDYHERT